MYVRIKIRRFATYYVVCSVYVYFYRSFRVRKCTSYIRRIFTKITHHTQSYTCFPCVFIPLVCHRIHGLVMGGNAVGWLLGIVCVCVCV